MVVRRYDTSDDISNAAMIENVADVGADEANDLRIDERELRTVHRRYFDRYKNVHVDGQQGTYDSYEPFTTVRPILRIFLIIWAIPSDHVWVHRFGRERVGGRGRRVY